MNHIASGPTRLLIRPKHEKNESLRGYASRASSCNGSSPQLKPMLASLQATTAAIHEIATLTDCCDSVLKKHGSYTQVGPDGHSGVLFGNCILPTNRVWMQRRMICPKCVSENGVSICCWELRDYDVCHEHGCYLVGRCSGCAQLFSWASTSSETCSCGVRLADLKTGMASINQRLICQLIADELSAAITLPNQEIIFGSLTPLNLFFIVSNFVRSILIPGFGQQHLGNTHSISNQTSEELLLAILKDSEYYGHLRQAIFLHAVGNPMTMARSLRSGISDKSIRDCFLPCLEKVRIHNHLMKAKAEVIKQRELDLLRKLDRAMLAKMHRTESHDVQQQSTAFLSAATGTFSENC